LLRLGLVRLLRRGAVQLEPDRRGAFAVGSPSIGKAIDRRGGRGVLVLSNLVLGAGLVWLALVQGPLGLAGAWAVLGIGMALGLYDAAFATLTALYGREARAPITGITLIAGFASTVGWPLSALLNVCTLWRQTTADAVYLLPAIRSSAPPATAAPTRALTARSDLTGRSRRT